MSGQGRHGHLLDVAVIGALLILVNVGLWMFMGLGENPNSGPSPDPLRSVASKLASVGVKGEAARYYEAYLDHADLSNETRAQVGLALAKLLKEEGHLEEALGQLYRVEAWSPRSTAARDASPLIVELLDRLGKDQAAQTALKARTQLGPKPRTAPKTTSPVVARLGLEALTLEDMNHAIDSLPPQIRAQFKTSEQKRAFLPQYVAQRLLYSKAQKRGLDKDPEIRREIEAMQQQLMVARMIEEELKDKVHVGEDDLRNYFEAHKKQFSSSDGKTTSFDQVAPQVQQAFMMSKVQILSQELLSEAQAAQEVQLYPEAVALSAEGDTP